MSETSEVTLPAIDNLKRLGFWAIRMNSGMRGGVRMAPKGTPDILVICPYVWLECKLPGEELSEDQLKFFERAKSEGVPCAKVTSWQEAVSVVRGAAMVESRLRYVAIQEALNRLTGQGI